MEGRFGEIVIHRHSGSGANLPRQAGPHCHQAVPLPDGSGYAVCDLGFDETASFCKIARKEAETMAKKVKANLEFLLVNAEVKEWRRGKVFRQNCAGLKEGTMIPNL